MRQLRLLREHYKREKLLNLVLYAREKRREIPDRCSRFLRRYLIIMNQNTRAAKELDARIPQSSCAPKRDFSNSFDDAERYNEQRCLDTFRFTMTEINELVQLLGLETHRDGRPFLFHTMNRCTYTGKEGSLLLLAHLTQAPTFLSLIGKGFTFGSVPNGTQLVNQVIRWLYMEWAGPLLSLPLRMWHDEKGPSGEPRAFYFRNCLSKRIQFQRRQNQGEELSEYDEEQLEDFFQSVRHTSFYLDGTTVDICRPGVNQRAQYNGYKKSHQISYQGLVAPDGLAVRLGGAFEGTLNDSAAYLRENLELDMHELHKEFRHSLHNPDAADDESDEDDEDEDAVGLFTIYADAAYSRTKYLKRSFKKRDGRISKSKQRFNEVMSSCRIHVENFFGQVKQNFKIMDDKPSFKLLQSIRRAGDEKYAFDMRVFCCVFLTNLRTCLNESSISAENDCVPPSVEKYLAMKESFLRYMEQRQAEDEE